jgi:hypothetical protein
MPRLSAKSAILVLCAALALISFTPDLALAADFTLVDEVVEPWVVLCASCVGFALGAGVFALPSLLAFLASPAGAQLLAACGAACLGAIAET